MEELAREKLSANSPGTDLVWEVTAINMALRFWNSFPVRVPSSKNRTNFETL